MDQYIDSQKLATYLHPGPGGPFLELNNEPLKPPSPGTSALLQHNPSLIDICKLGTFCQRFVDNSSTSNTLPYKQHVSPSDLYFQIPSTTQIDCLNQVDDSNAKSAAISESNPSPISSVDDCSPNVSSYESTPYTSPKVKHLIPDMSPISSKKDSASTTVKHNLCNEILTNTELSPEKSSTNILNTETDNYNTQQLTNADSYTSPILLRLLTSPTKSNDISSSQNEKDSLNNISNKSPHYRPRYSPYYKIQSRPIFRDHFTKRSSQKNKSTIETDHNTCQSHVNLTVQSTALLTLDTNGVIFADQSHGNKVSSMNNNKRCSESSVSEQASSKRRYEKSFPYNVIQRNNCLSYPDNISRCIDCENADPCDMSLHLVSCRFQYCRILKYFGENKFQVDGFTTSDKAKAKYLEPLRTSNSSGQPPLNYNDANYIFMQITKLFSLMFHHEQNERMTHSEKDIIWKRYMPGWREVCDDCITTLFNYHYMCKLCGYMSCIECSNQFNQLTMEKRKKFNRSCIHNESYCLSEFIPWDIIVKLRNSVIDHLSKLKIDYTVKLYNSTKTENLSVFIKTLKMRRTHDARDVQKYWSSSDCNNDPNIEFYCHGRLPVFNEWTSENAKQFFRKVWSASCPVLVKRVHNNLSNVLWHPNSFKEHMIDHKETPALWDCETLTPIPTDEDILTRFWDGFERLNVRLRDDQHGRRPRILKLKDWPTKKDFASVFPSLLHDLMGNIPFGDYTRRSYSYDGVIYHGGTMNIVERLPSYLVKPDLGPKLYIAYSQLTSQATRKAGTTNLHIDVSDAVNVLVYVGIGGNGEDGSDKEDEIRQVEKEVLNSNIDEAQLQRLRNGERPGALWHLFRSDDAKKIREYIGRTQRKVAGSDSIHDQTAYLEKDDLEKLRDWSKVESYPILQFLGDAVFIPSGAPHQVRNLHSCIKIAEDFVSPENLDRSLITTNEFRSLSKTHTNHADILQAKNILYYTTRDALNSLSESIKTESSLSSSS